MSSGDERRFHEPDAFDVGRDTRGHVGFGFGQHFCLGASLARLEAQVALEALVPHLLRARRTSADKTLLDSFLVRGPSRLELRLAAGSAEGDRVFGPASAARSEPQASGVDQA